MQVEQSAFACSEVSFSGFLLKKDDSLGLTSYTFQNQIINIWIATALLRHTLLDRSILPGYHAEVKDVGEDGVVRGFMLHFKPRAQVMRNAEDLQVSRNQRYKR